MKSSLALFVILALGGCSSNSDNRITPDDRIMIEIIREFKTNKPIEVRLSCTNLAWPDVDLLDIFRVESGHHPSVYWVRATKTDEYSVSGCYITKNEEEASLLSMADHRTHTLVLFMPEKEIRITPGNAVPYITGTIVKKH